MIRYTNSDIFREPKCRSSKNGTLTRGAACSARKKNKILKNSRKLLLILIAKKNSLPIEPLITALNHINN